MRFLMWFDYGLENGFMTKVFNMKRSVSLQAGDDRRIQNPSFDFLCNDWDEKEHGADAGRKRLNVLAC